MSATGVKESFPGEAIQTLWGVQTLRRITDQFRLGYYVLDLFVRGLARSHLTSLTIRRCEFPAVTTAMLLDWAIASKDSVSSLDLSSNCKWPKQHIGVFPRVTAE